MVAGNLNPCVLTNLAALAEFLDSIRGGLSEIFFSFDRAGPLSVRTAAASR